MARWSLSKRIWFVLGLLVLAFGVSVAIAFVSFEKLRNAMDDIGNVYVKRALIANTIRDNQRQLALATFELVGRRDAASAQKAIEKFNKIDAIQNQMIADFLAICTDFGKKTLGEYKVSADKWYAIVQEADTVATGGDFKKAAELVLGEEAFQYRKEMLDKVQGLVDFNVGKLQDTITDGGILAQRSLAQMFSISFISILISLTIAFFVLRMTTRAIREVVVHLNDSSN